MVVVLAGGPSLVEAAAMIFAWLAVVAVAAAYAVSQARRVDGLRTRCPCSGKSWSTMR